MVTENTGPKGVILDSQVAAARANQDRCLVHQERLVRMISRVPISTTVLEDENEKTRELKLDEQGGYEDALSQETVEEYSKTKARLVQTHEADECEADSDLDSELEELLDLDMNGERKREDMSALQKWREKRLRELRAVAGQSSLPGHKQTFGTLKLVDSDGYLEALESGDLNQVVIVLLFDESQESKMISTMLSHVAQKYITSNFIQMHYLETEMDRVGIPAILAYTNHGDRVIANIPRVEDELSPASGLAPAALEGLLKR
ncbi:hypothetical protein V1525DRAFT_438011 [Lipomyces kononenkoae]|uniref:Uncharacterized protein n=1 Tax=Lipomyces kononenkoae TaxID=34357 RepID=A0ACC3T6Q9_LIPKO